MITRKALDECLDRARGELSQTPPDGMLWYLLHAQKDFPPPRPFSELDVQVIALAYSYAVQKEARP